MKSNKIQQNKLHSTIHSKCLSNYLIAHTHYYISINSLVSLQRYLSHAAYKDVNKSAGWARTISGQEWTLASECSARARSRVSWRDPACCVARSKGKCPESDCTTPVASASAAMASSMLALKKSRRKSAQLEGGPGAGDGSQEGSVADIMEGAEAQSIV